MCDRRRTRQRHAQWFALGASTVTLSVAAHSARLTYAADAPCPSRDEFVELMRRRLPTLELDSGAGPDVAVVIREVKPAGRYTGRLVIDRKTDAARVLEGTSCGEVAEATAFAAVIAIAPEALVASPPAGSATETASSEPTPAPTSPTPSSSERAPQTTRPAVDIALPAPDSEKTESRPALELAIASATGVGPGIAYGTQFGLHFWSASPWSPELGIAARYVEVYGASGGIESYALLSLGASACLPVTASPSFGPCASVEGGSHTATEVGSSNSRGDAWFAAGLGLRARFRLGSRWAILVGGRAVVPFIRNRFIESGQAVFTTPEIATAAELGVGWATE